MRVGTRRSPLAQAQADRAMQGLPEAQKVLIESDGDQDLVRPLDLLGNPGAFTATLTRAILDGRIDAAVHSLKDLPLDAPDGAPVVAVLPRDDPADVLLVRDGRHDPKRPLHLSAGSRVGTSAPRRRSQLLDADPSLIPVDVRGNVQTRLRLLETGVVDGLLMAAAVFERIRLPLPRAIRSFRLDPERFPGSPGQGAVAVQSTPAVAGAWQALGDLPTRQATEAERAVLRALGGGCGLPLGVYVGHTGSVWRLDATYGHSAGLTRFHAEGDDVASLVRQAVAALSRPPAPPPAPPAMQQVIVTLPEERLAPYRAVLGPRGYELVAWPLVGTRPTGAPLPPDAHAADWIAVTSPRAAPWAAQAAGDRPVRVAAVGRATADALRAQGLPVHVVAEEGDGASLATDLLRFPERPRLVLWPVATRPAGGLQEALEAAGVRVLPWPVYETLPTATACPVPHAAALVLCSPSAVSTYVHHPDPPTVGRTIAFGPTTAAAMDAAGTPADAVCPARVPQALLEILP